MHRGDRGNVDDRTTARAFHCRKNGPATEEHTIEIHAHHPAPLGERGLHHVAEHHEARIVHKTIDPSEALLRGRDDPRPVFLARDIVVEEDRLGAQICQQLLRTPRRDVGEHEPRALPREECRVRATDAAQCARDDDDLAGKPAHVSPPV